MSAFLLSTFLLVTMPVQPSIQRAQNSNAPNQDFDQIAVSPNSSQIGSSVCLKMRVYVFERNDGMAPKLVRETTCTDTRPFLHTTRAPKARLIPAN